MIGFFIVQTLNEIDGRYGLEKLTDSLLSEFPYILNNGDEHDRKSTGIEMS
jgi:hypothetical protein